MAGVKISALPPVASALASDIFPVVQAGVTSQETLAQVATLLGTTIVTPANGGIVYTNATGLQVLTPTATARQLLTSGANTAPVWSTSTYPLTNAINTLLYASGANTMAALATANSSVLVTSSGGIPSLATALPGGLTTSDPITAQGIATKNYVDSIATGGAAPCVCATTANLNATQVGAGVGATLTNAGSQAAFSVDGITPTATSRILVKNQSTTANNGIYILTNAGSGATNWVLTRATDYDTPTDINDTGVIPVVSGTANANTGWINTTVNLIVDTTAITYVQFGASYPISLANGGTGAALTASNGGIFYSTASAGAILSGTATAGQLLTSGSSTTPAWSTSTYPLTNAANTLLYASSANTMAALSTANSSGLLTNGSGIPAWVTVTGTGAPVLATSPTLITPTLGAATATSLAFSPTTGGIVGTTTNDNAGAGKVGEFVSSVIANASAVAINSSTNTDLTSISLTAGDWDVWGNINFGTISVSASFIGVWISSTSATLPDNSLFCGLNLASGTIGSQSGINAPTVRVSLSGTTTIYITGRINLNTGTANMCGGIYARRAR